MSHGSTSITSWLVRVVLIVAALGVVGDDAVSTLAANVGVIDDANSAARVGRQVLAGGGTYQEVDQAVADYASAHGETVAANATAISADGTVSVQLVHHVHTLVLGRIPWLGSLTTAVATGVAAPGP